MKNEFKLTSGKHSKDEIAVLTAKLGRGSIVKIGFLAGATYPDGLNVAQVAFWNEFGTSRIPPRPFFRGMIKDKSPMWGKALAKNLKATNYDRLQTMALMGQGIKDQLVQSIVEFSTPPNSPYTIAKKGFDKPLVDTGVMQRTPDYEVTDGSELT